MVDFPICVISSIDVFFRFLVVVCFEQTLVLWAKQKNDWKRWWTKERSRKLHQSSDKNWTLTCFTKFQTLCVSNQWTGVLYKWYKNYENSVMDGIVHISIEMKVKKILTTQKRIVAFVTLHLYEYYDITLYCWFGNFRWDFRHIPSELRWIMFRLQSW